MKDGGALRPELRADFSYLPESAGKPQLNCK